MPDVVGIDAGGSHTRALRVTRLGEVVAEGTSGPANIFFTEEPEARAHIATAVAAVLRDSVAPVTGCLTGPNLPPDALRILEAAAPETQWVVVTEAAACRAAIFHDADAAGCIVQCGTGTFAEGRWPSGLRVRRGGWGPIVGDEGSGTMIALEGLRAVVRAAEGRGPLTSLTEAMLEACDITQLTGLKEFLYRPFIRRHRLAALCPVVARVAKAGDAVALRILEEAGHALGELAAAVLLAPEAPGPTIPTALFGGVVQHVPQVAAACERHLRNVVPETDIQTTHLHPVDGAIAVAFQAAKADAAQAMQAIAERRRAEDEAMA